MIGKLLCWLGRHKWYSVGPLKMEWVSKWEAYEHAQGKCARCGKEVPDIRREYFW